MTTYPEYAICEFIFSYIHGEDSWVPASDTYPSAGLATGHLLTMRPDTINEDDPDDEQPDYQVCRKGEDGRWEPIS